jgi:hypothetical protein
MVSNHCKSFQRDVDIDVRRGVAGSVNVVGKVGNNSTAARSDLPSANHVT